MSGEKIGEAFVVVRPDTKGFAAEADSNISGALGRTFANVTKMAATAAAAGGAALAGLGAWGLKSAADMQQVEIAFEGIFQSGVKSKAFLDDLRAFAAKTPFEFPELARSAKMLLATGTAAEDVIPVMTKLGNVAATLGVGGAEIEGVVRALGQMQGKGKASAEELQQISEQIPGFSAIKAIAESMGITVEEAFDKMSKGAISADTAIAAILQGMEKFPGAAGAMERQAKTLSGVFSTLKDTARDALVKGISPALPALADAVNKAMPQIGSALGALGGTFGKLVTTAAPLLEKLLPIVVKLAEGVGSLLTRAVDRLLPIIDKIAPIFDDLLTALDPLIEALLDALAPILAELAPVFLEMGAKIARSLTPVIIELTPALVKLAEIFAKVLDIIGPEGVLVVLAMRQAMKTLELGKQAMDLAMNVNPYVALITASALAAVLVVEHWSTVKGAVIGGLNDVIEGINELIRLYNSIPLLPNIGEVNPVDAGNPEWIGPDDPRFVGPVPTPGWTPGPHPGDPDFVGPVDRRLYPAQASGGYTIDPGWSWVGKHDDELAYMPKGATVVPLDQAPGLMGGGDIYNTFNIQAPVEDPYRLAYAISKEQRLQQYLMGT